jgi:hypothetical protein
VFGVPGTFPVERGQARGTGHRIGPRRTKNGFGGRDWERFLSGASQITLGDGLGDTTGNALSVCLDCDQTIPINLLAMTKKLVYV